MPPWMAPVPSLVCFKPRNQYWVANVTLPTNLPSGAGTSGAWSAEAKDAQPRIDPATRVASRLFFIVTTFKLVAATGRRSSRRCLLRHAAASVVLPMCNRLATCAASRRCARIAHVFGAFSRCKRDCRCAAVGSARSAGDEMAPMHKKTSALDGRRGSEAPSGQVRDDLGRAPAAATRVSRGAAVRRATADRSRVRGDRDRCA
jgi:hypothetical protein